MLASTQMEKGSPIITKQHSLATILRRVQLLVLLCIPMVCFTQKATLKGVISGTEPNQPPTRVWLFMRLAPVAATCASIAGQYSFYNLEAGIYRLRFAQAGKWSITKNNIAVHSGDTVVVDVPALQDCPYQYFDDIKPQCPRNKKDDIIPIVYGLPKEETIERAKAGKLRLGGCIKTECSPQYYCPRHKLSL